MLLYSCNRKRTHGNPSAVIKNGYYNYESKASRSIHPDSIDDGHDMQGKEASSQEPHEEPAGQDTVLDVSQPFDDSDLDKVCQPCSSNALSNFYHKSGFFFFYLETNLAFKRLEVRRKI